MTTATHLSSLGRAEATLFVRAKGNIVNVLFIPVMLLVVLVVTMTRFDLDSLGLALGPVMLSTTAGVVLVFALYVPLTTAYVVRRDELLLKRLRTGELSDPVILTGTALPAVAVAVVQFLLVSAIVVALTDAGLPTAPHYPLIALVLGCAMLAALACATSAFARNAENVQAALLPAVLVLPATSGAFFPLEAMPQEVQDVFQWTPLAPVIDLVRAGWSGDVGAGEALVRVGTLAAWTAIAAGAGHRWFRWEPRT
ncbi:ABC transporter permease [Nocardiopsis halophila]|uniref:ABC transporter permease n=1 Tax=Nocardiopsis halophila TaxID=141692 RepID=UPI000346C008|nr:ABC transporter permease [Nocardiopsis halophila]